MSTYAPISYNGGFIALSYIISVVGSLTTLELLRRVTSARGLLNWFLLVSSAFSMGGVAIWCMHYIGNRAIVLYGGQPRLQLSYSAGFTVLSFFMPVIVLLLAYIIIGGVENPAVWRLLVGGTVAGAAICGMHYLGQLSIVNYTSTYDIGNVVGSVIIAIAATIIALTLFFRLRQKWDDAFWKRAVCALILAGAVSGMHWTAATGTSYTPIPNSANYPSGRWTVVVVAVISFLSCVFLLWFAFQAGRMARKRRNRAQKVVLASATFDPDGKVMLTMDGMFPCREITDSFHERSFEENFDTAHPVFLWIYRASFNWDSIRDLIAGMRNHLKATVRESSTDYSPLFREMFCITAQALADSLSLPLESLGIAYDQILETGVKQKRSRSLSGRLFPLTTNFGRGQFLFLVKHASRAEAAHLLSSGYRFADPVLIVGNVARAMQIDRTDAESQLAKMSNYYGPADTFEPGVHLAFFGMRPKVVQKGFNVIVRENRSHVIPSMQLGVDVLDDEQKRFVMSFVGRTVDQVLQELRAPQTHKLNYDMQTFRSQFHGALVSLSQEINEPAFMDAVMLSQTFEVNANRKDLSDHPSRSTATLIVFRSIVPIHNSIQHLQSSQLIYSPLALFLTQQSVLSRSSRSTFARESRKEFLALFESSMSSTLESRSRTRRPQWFALGRKYRGDTTSSPWLWAHFLEDGKVSKNGLGHEVAIKGGSEAIQLTPPLGRAAEFGPPGENSMYRGIVVQKSVTVMVRDKDPDDTSKTSEISNSSMSEVDSPGVLNDDAIWANICFKGLQKDNIRGGWMI